MSDTITALFVRNSQLEVTRNMWVGRIDRLCADHDVQTAALESAMTERKGFDGQLWIDRIDRINERMATAFQALDAIDGERAEVLDQIYELAWAATEQATTHTKQGDQDHEEHQVTAGCREAQPRKGCSSIQGYPGRQPGP